MQDDHADELCLVLKGRVRVYHITKNGDEINYDVLDKGRIFGESSLYENAYRPTTVSAINDVEIITCHLEDLYPYLSSSLDLTITLLKMFNDNCNHLTQLLKWAQTYDRFEKVAAFLYELSATNNIEKNLLFGDIPYTHQEIADSLAISRVTVTKVLNQFKEKGLILNWSNERIVRYILALSFSYLIPMMLNDEGTINIDEAVDEIVECLSSALMKVK